MANELDELRDVIDDRLRRVNTAIPGRISSYNASTRKAEVEPLIKEKYADGTILSLPRISGVPVVMPSSSSAGLALPIAAGDPVLILFAQRSIDRWLSSGGLAESADKRMHALSDAIAIPGLFPFSETHADGAGVRLYGESSEVRVEAGSALKAVFKAQSDGKVAIGTTAVEFVDIMDQLMTDLALVYSAAGVPSTTLLALQALLQSIKGSI